ncbi:hypothetical protein GCM10011344_40900 [Dokdonia pacifica]|nr:hypothetical protein GCM10011344_40900 [Dokdonia pacifica]
MDGSQLFYVDLLLLPSVIASIIFLINLVFKSNINKTIYNNASNPFVADDPIESESEDKLQYDKRAKSLIQYLDKSNFKRSFTIGIVGPWGNGKSSLISLIEKELYENPKKQTLHLKFLPFLNHSENDIISEFFKQLSSEINKYSGRLSNQVLDYSEKLLKLYKNKSIKEFLTINNVSYSKTSSYETYVAINKTLEGLNKKFIIFIDDLDRLSNKEVLQVLKLVRNTANFKNFIFVIALDKDYVLNTLMIKNDVSDHAFVDKFFQLEVYLPEIEKSQLKNDFIDFLKASGLRSEESFIIEVERAINRKDNLFDDYISNHRGVKRLVNQLVFDFNSLPDQLNTNDLLNFTYLKMTFPSAIKFLNSNWTNVIPYNRNTKLCELETVPEEENKRDIFSSNNASAIFLGIGKYTPDYSKYKISSSLSEQKELSEINHLSQQQNLLLAKTLIILFGEDNKAKGDTSIKFGNNLRKLLQQKILENELSYSEFKDIFSVEGNFQNLKNAIRSSQTQNILDRISFYNVDTIECLNPVILVLLFIFNSSKENNIYPSTVLQILSSFVIRNKKNIENPNSKEIWKTIKKKYLEKNQYKIEEKLEFLAFLSENRIRMSFDDWGASEESLKEISLELFEKLLKEKDSTLWDIHDYSFYHSYQNTRKFHVLKTLNPLMIDFWRKNNITILCAQLTENKAFTIKNFKTSNFASQVFGSFEGYKSFIEQKIGDTKDSALIEYLDFIKLESYTNFSSPIRYEFRDFKLVKNKMQRVKQNNSLKHDEFDTIIELFITSSTEEYQKITVTNLNIVDIPGFIEHRYYRNKNNFFTTVKIQSSDIHKAKSMLLDHYLMYLSRKEKVFSIDNEELSISRLHQKEPIIKIISIQPKSYS